MPFFTRPNFEDRQHLQYSGSSITLSGFTNINQTGQLIILGPILDFTGTTTASTSVTMAGVTGYINNDNISSLKIEPPKLYLSGNTGSTIVDVTNYVLTSFDSSGNVIWKQSIGTTSGDCISDFYVSNLHGCSPITVWDQFQHTTCSATGQSSNAFGYYTNSYGDYSNSEGYSNYAIGNYSHAEGNYPDRDANIAIGDGSHAEGSETTSNGFGSHAEGDGSTANGIASHSEGFGTTSDGYASHTEGDSTISIGDYSHAEGRFSKSISKYSHSEGVGNISGLIYLNCIQYVSGGTTSDFFIDPLHGDVTNYFNAGDDLFISDVHSNKNFLVSVNQFSVDVVSYQEISPSLSATVISIYGDLGYQNDVDIYISNLTTLLLPDTIPYSYENHGSHSEGSYENNTPSSNTLGNISFGIGSHVEGVYDSSYVNVAYGLGSNAKGFNTKSIGNYSYSSGENTYSDGDRSFIHSFNSYIKNSNDAIILGGYSNNIVDSNTSSILNGSGNQISNNSKKGGIICSNSSSLLGSDDSIILGGLNNTIETSNYSTILGGNNNNIKDSGNSTIIGGDNNTIDSLTNVFILGSSNKTALNNDTVYVPDLVITPFTIPTSSGDTVGEVGSISWDDTYFYIKTNTGWGRTLLDYSF